MVSAQVPQVLVATQSKEVLNILRTRDDVRYEIALYTSTIKEVISDCQLVIIDFEDIVEYQMDKADLSEALFRSQVPQYSSQEFRNRWEEILQEIHDQVDPLQSYCMAFVSYSGGTGRTTLALDTAVHYANTMKRQPKKRAATQPIGRAMAVEFTYGISSLVSITGLDLAGLYSVATKPDTEILSFKDVDLVAMNYENARVLSPDLLQRCVDRQMALHNLTIIDASWPHPLIDALRNRIKLWIVVTSERPDAIANANRLHDELREEAADARVWVALNQASRAAQEKKAATEREWDLILPNIPRADELRGELGRVILNKAFAPVWQEYEEQAGGSRGWFG